MSVEVAYKGRFGNRAFQYACARLFARERGLQLVGEFPDQHILPVSETERGDVVETPRIPIGDDDDIWSLPKLKAFYRFDGFFQKPHWYFMRRKELEEIFLPRRIGEVNRKDIIANIRLGDYRIHNIVIHPKWYVEILEKESFGRLTIVIDEPDREYLRHFDRWNPSVVTGNPASDWDLLRSYEKLIASNSTYCWWAMFFGAARSPYIFQRWIGNPKAQLQEFPGAVQVPGDFLHEAPAD